jgi:hypothetical protein
VAASFLSAFVPFCQSSQVKSVTIHILTFSPIHKAKAFNLFTMTTSNTHFDTSTLEVMRKQEESGYRGVDYLHQQQPQACTMNGPQNNGASVDVDCRFRMAEWCYQIVDFCKFKRETVCISMSYLDRFLSSNCGHEILLDRFQFQLAAMTALYTAVKIHEPEAMDPNLIASLSRGVYNKEQVEAMEFKMLNAIQWRVNPPTAVAFIHEMLNLVPSDILNQDARQAVIDLAKYQAELAVPDYGFVTANASSIAFASLMNAMESIHMDIKLRSHVEDALAQAGKIDSQSARIRDIRIRLYEAISRQPGSTQLVSSLAPQSTCTVDYTKTENSVHASPTSVSAAQ